ncbi:Manganese/iron superoxide dismutase [Xylariomycetidae sp. FL0641]|nr:Manganese/iron superoxide dismutase [Xylariomycetidae sp. FL0641]
MFRTRLRIPRLNAPVWRSVPAARSYHQVPQLAIRREEGVPGLLTPEGFDFAWTDYMEMAVTKLGNMTRDTDFQNKPVLDIIKSTAREPYHAPLFNYASMAHNNHMFFEGLTARSVEQYYQDQEEAAQRPYEDRIPDRLRATLIDNFSSIETLRREILFTGLGMFGPGFVWLVKNARTMEHRILATYLAGSPYTAAHWRRQGVDLNTSSGDKYTVSQYQERAKAGLGGAGKFENQAPGGIDVIPLLCLNTWEFVWLRDYGIGLGGGKEKFIEAWWDVIDWNQVDARADTARTDTFK